MRSFEQHHGPQVGLVGKIPSKGDFVRENVDEALNELDQWLQSAVAELHLAQRELPMLIARFVMRLPATRKVVTGVIAPSQDQHGRRFPLAMACQVPLEAAGPVLPAVPAVLDAWFQGLEDLVRELPALSFDEVRGALAGLAPPPPEAFGRLAQQVLARVRDEPVWPFLERTLGPWQPGVYCYALSTLCAAATALSGRQDGTASGPSVPCPGASDADAAMWLYLAQRLTPLEEGLSAAIWVAESTSSLLLSWGRAPEQALRFWVDPNTTANQLWPMCTDVQSARDAAVSAVGSMLEAQRTKAHTTIGELSGALTEWLR